jgi:hypothetical protein
MLCGYFRHQLAKSDNIQLLEKSFTQKDWQYLSQHPVFKNRLSAKNETLEDYEDILEIGELLIRQREELSGRNPDARR